MTTTYMTFTMDASKVKTLLDTNPDYFIFTVGADLVNDPENPEKQLAALAFTADAFKTGGEEPLAAAKGCPVPPCVAGGN